MLVNKLNFYGTFCGIWEVTIIYFHYHADFLCIIKGILIRDVVFHHVNHRKGDSVDILGFFCPKSVHMVAYFPAMRIFLAPLPVQITHVRAMTGSLAQVGDEFLNIASW